MSTLEQLVGAEHVVTPAPSWALRDATEWAGVTGQADALVRPGGTEEVAAVVAWCRERGVPVTARGGGTGLAGGAAPAGGIVLSLDRLTALRIDGFAARAGAGVTTATLRRRAREEGLLFGPDPGAGESSVIGGNVATNAGGPHSALHGPVRRWLLGVEAVLGTGEIVRSGGGALPRRSTGIDLAQLLCGSEGTLGVICAVDVRLEPAPEAVRCVRAVYDTAQAAGAAVLRVLQSGLRPSALDFLDAGAAAAAGARGHLVLAEVEGDEVQVEARGQDLLAALETGEVVEPRALWQWRDGMAHAVAAQRGGKLSEDVAVPVERLADAIEATVAIGERHRLPACSWGHAADGILHSALMIDRDEPDEVRRAHAAAEDLFDMALELGGTLSGEHGLGRLKRHRAADVLDPGELAAMRAVKAALDPDGILNPGAGPC